MEPEILTHPNIPKPLHGLNPRTLLGKEWWDTTRFKAQEDYNFCCAACGTPKLQTKGPKWLEGHEYFTINYETGICEVEKIVPLCHYCHNFIHSGRLSMIMNKEKTVDEVKLILQHGFDILHNHNLKAFPSTLQFANQLNVNTYNIKSAVVPQSNLNWSDWKLKLNDTLYDSKFKSYDDWLSFYQR